MPAQSPLLKFLLAGLLLLMPAVAQEKPLTLEQLAEETRPMALHRTIQADYTQIRHLRELDFEMKVVGKFAQEQGGRLAWITTSPIHSVCLLSKDSFQFWDEESRRTTTLNAEKFPWIRLLFQLQSHWMTGDLKSLEGAFQLQLEGENTLRMTPRDQTVKQFFQTISITFGDDFKYVHKVVFTEKSEDTITLLFQNILYDKEIPAEVWKWKK